MAKSDSESSNDLFEDNPIAANVETEKPVKKYKCETCHYYETGTPIKWCRRCSDDYKELQKLAEAIQERIGFVHRDASPAIKKQLNLLVGEVNELRLKVRRLGG